eukprot:scaffold84971_cov70-Phaeocystis_antarctica.AAC.2
MVEVTCGEAAATRAEEPPPKRLEGCARQFALPVGVRVDDCLKVRRCGGAVLGRLGGGRLGVAAVGRGLLALEEAVLDLDQLRVLLLRRRKAVEQPRARHLQRVPRHVERCRRHPVEHLAARLCLAVGLEEKREREQVVPRLACAHVALRLHHRLSLRPRLARCVPAAAQLVAGVLVERLRGQVEVVLEQREPRLEAQCAVAQRLRVAKVVAQQRDRQVEHPHQAAPVDRVARAATLAVDAGALLEARRRECVGAVLGEVAARSREEGRAAVLLERRVRVLKPLDHRLHVALEPVELRLPPLEHARRLQNLDLARRGGSLQQCERLAEAQLGLLDVRLLVLGAQLGAQHELQRGAPPVLAHDGDLRVEGGRSPVLENHEREDAQVAVSAQRVLVRAVAPPLLRAVVDDASLLDGALLVGGTLCLHPLVVDHQHAGCLDRAQWDGLHIPSRRGEHLVQVDGHHPGSATKIDESAKNDDRCTFWVSYVLG